MNAETLLGALVESRKALVESQRAIDAMLLQRTNTGNAELAEEQSAMGRTSMSNGDRSMRLILQSRSRLAKSTMPLISTSETSLYSSFPTVPLPTALFPRPAAIIPTRSGFSQSVVPVSACSTTTTHETAKAVSACCCPMSSFPRGASYALIPLPDLASLSDLNSVLSVAPASPRSSTLAKTCVPQISSPKTATSAISTPARPGGRMLVSHQMTPVALLRLPVFHLRFSARFFRCTTTAVSQGFNVCYFPKGRLSVINLSSLV
jgi:hypothetical protein